MGEGKNKNNFELGNRLRELREKIGLTQAQLGTRIGVESVTISKWECGRGLPRQEYWGKLEKILGCSSDEFIKEKTINKKIIKIAITGAPCAGKTTIINTLVKESHKKDYAILTVPEIATELINSGVSPADMGVYEFQKAILEMQINREESYMKIANDLKQEKVVIICDRGAMDGDAYLEDFEVLVNSMGRNKIELRDSYDAVIHLVTFAKNESLNRYDDVSKEGERFEKDRQEVEALDLKTLNAWMGHRYLKLIQHEVTFETKAKKVLSEIFALVEEPQNIIQKKFLVKYPSEKTLTDLMKKKLAVRVEITQIYLNSSKGTEIRIRQQGINGKYTFFKRIKTKSACEEISITAEEYLNLQMDNSDGLSRIIRKTRYYFISDNQYFQLDIFPFWKDKALLELKVNKSCTKIPFPKILEKIAEVTDDKNYLNFHLAEQYSHINTENK